MLIEIHKIVLCPCHLHVSCIKFGEILKFLLSLELDLLIHNFQIAPYFICTICLIDKDFHL
jgi:hypothetical protein